MADGTISQKNTMEDKDSSEKICVAGPSSSTTTDLIEWNPREKLSLASALQKFGSTDWSRISRVVKSVVDPRPAGWFSAKNCQLQFANLLSTFKRKHPKLEPPEIVLDTMVVALSTEYQRFTAEELEDSIANAPVLLSEIKRLENGQVSPEEIDKFYMDFIKEQTNILTSFNESDEYTDTSDRDEEEDEIETGATDSEPVAEDNTLETASVSSSESAVWDNISYKAQSSEEESEGSMEALSEEEVEMVDLSSPSISPTKSEQGDQRARVSEGISQDMEIEFIHSAYANHRNQMEFPKTTITIVKQFTDDNMQPTALVQEDNVPHVVETEVELPHNAGVKEILTEEIEENLPEVIEIEEEVSYAVETVEVSHVIEAENALATDSEEVSYVAATEELPHVVGTEVLSHVVSAEVPHVIGTEVLPHVAAVEDMPQIDATEDLPQVAETGDMPQVASTEDLPQVVGTEAEDLPRVTGTEDLPQVTGTEGLPQVTGTEDLPQVAGTEDLPQVAGMEELPQVAGTEDLTHVADTEEFPQKLNAEECFPKSIELEAFTPGIEQEDKPPSEELAGKSCLPSQMMDNLDQAVERKDGLVAAVGTDGEPDISESEENPMESFEKKEEVSHAMEDGKREKDVYAGGSHISGNGEQLVIPVKTEEQPDVKKEMGFHNIDVAQTEFAIPEKVISDLEENYELGVNNIGVQDIIKEEESEPNLTLSNNIVESEMETEEVNASQKSAEKRGIKRPASSMNRCSETSVDTDGEKAFVEEDGPTPTEDYQRKTRRKRASRLQALYKEANTFFPSESFEVNRPPGTEIKRITRARTKTGPTPRAATMSMTITSDDKGIKPLAHANTLNMAAIDTTSVRQIVQAYREKEKLVKRGEAAVALPTESSVVIADSGNSKISETSRKSISKKPLQMKGLLLDAVDKMMRLPGSDSLSEPLNVPGFVFDDLTLAIIRERILAGFVYSPSCLNREVSVLLLNRLVLKGYVEFGTICRQVMDIIDSLGESVGSRKTATSKEEQLDSSNKTIMPAGEFQEATSQPVVASASARPKSVKRTARKSETALFSGTNAQKRGLRSSQRQIPAMSARK